MIEQSVAESRAERMIRAYMEGAESGMVEIRGYGLTADERKTAETQASALYGNLGEPESSTEEVA